MGSRNTYLLFGEVCLVVPSLKSCTQKAKPPSWKYGGLVILGPSGLKYAGKKELGKKTATGVLDRWVKFRNIWLCQKEFYFLKVWRVDTIMSVYRRQKGFLESLGLVLILQGDNKTVKLTKLYIIFQ